MLGAVRELNRLELVGETLRHALHTLAALAPDWLRRHLPPEWVDRYGHQLDEYRLSQQATARQQLASVIGVDGGCLLGILCAPDTPRWLREVPAVETLRWVWMQRYYAPAEGGTRSFREEADMPPAALRCSSPHDPDVRAGAKRETTWLGYKLHLTEACEPDTPLLITDVRTTLATTTDYEMTGKVQAALAERDLLPATHVVDAG